MGDVSPISATFDLEWVPELGLKAVVAIEGGSELIAMPDVARLKAQVLARGAPADSADRALADEGVGSDKWSLQVRA